MRHLMTASVLAIVLAAPGAAETDAKTEAAGTETATAIFAGGCFWCVEADFDKVAGVSGTLSGYIGGTTDEPTYKQVTFGNTGHYEAVRITYDPAVVDFETLTEIFFRTVDPTDAGGQFCDRGDSYRTAIFVDGEEERRIAEAEKAEADEALDEDVVTPILDTAEFWPAEDYHQNYYKKNPISYTYYRFRCGRDARVEALWGKDAEDAVKELAPSS